VTGVPQAAIDAAIKALKDAALLNNAGYLPGDEEWAAEAVIAAAAPHLYAAQRERDAQLADKHGAWIPGKTLGPGVAEPGRWFSAIIRQEDH
jgi:hypothetical protein